MVEESGRGKERGKVKADQTARKRKLENMFWQNLCVSQCSAAVTKYLRITT